MRLAVVIATAGRPQAVRQVLARLDRQIRPADLILVVGASPADLPATGELPAARGGTQRLLTTSARGSSRQRNHALDQIEASCDLAIFLDDDFVPAKDFLAGAERVMRENPDVVAASGALIADGVRSAGIPLEEADALVTAYEAGEPRRGLAERPSAYGCNMIVRCASVRGERFDEALPLYGWLEDWDFSRRLAPRGRIVEAQACTGVHLCVKVGRSPGRQLGYSQIANPIHLARLGTMTWRMALETLGRCLLANATRAAAPEAHIDRRGRLGGNLRALVDLSRGRLHPGRAARLGPSTSVSARPRQSADVSAQVR